MGACRRVHLLDRGESVFADQVRNADERRPAAPMNEGDLLIDEPEAQHVRRIVDLLEQSKDLVSGLVGPPASANRFPRDGVGEIGQRSLRGSEDHSVLLDEGDRIETQTEALSEMRKQSKLAKHRGTAPQPTTRA